jgi:predicted membrane-bound spermidine synthase
MVVFNQKVAGYLMLQKFTLKDINKNNSNPRMNVFVFDDTEDLRKAISEYDNFIEKCRDYLIK